MASKSKLGTAQMQLALEKRYAGNAWALFFEVRNGTGYARKRDRYVDALAMSLWPSRGLELHGHEIKASRSDWLNELKQPEKAEEIARFCDRWWLVVGDESIVKDDELPPTWGLMVPKGKSLVVKVQAPELTPQPIDRLFLASLLRSAANYKPTKSSFDVKLEREYERGYEQGVNHSKTDIQIAQMGQKHAEDELNALRKSIAAFQKESGLRFTNWTAGDIGEEVRRYMQAQNRMDETVTTARRMADELTARGAHLRETADALEQLAEKGTHADG